MFKVREHFVIPRKRDIGHGDTRKEIDRFAIALENL